MKRPQAPDNGVHKHLRVIDLTTALTDVRVFDGRRLVAPGTVVIEADRIATDAGGARVIDGRGGVLCLVSSRRRRGRGGVRRRTGRRGIGLHQDRGRRPGAQP